MVEKVIRPVEILLVEDNPGDVELAAEALEDGTSINNLHVVTDGEAAMDFLRKRAPYENAPRPDIIFLDLNLPKKDGREVLVEIKDDPTLKHIPVVVMTTSEAEEDIVKSYNLHANCYLTKPFHVQQFFRLIRSIENFWLSIVVLPPKEMIDGE